VRTGAGLPGRRGGSSASAWIGGALAGGSGAQAQASAAATAIVAARIMASRAAAA
jgi:hypothetical protein